MTSGQFNAEADGVVRLSRGTFDPGRYAEIQQLSNEAGSYLIPAIREVAGLNAYFAGASPSGSMINVSLWDTLEHADQVSRLPEMAVRARNDLARLDMSFIPIVNYPIGWRI